MKNKVSQFCLAYGHRTYYSGNTRTMYIDAGHFDKYMVEANIIKHFGYGLPFKIHALS